MAMKIDADSVQIHCRASLVMITEWATDFHESIEEVWGGIVAQEAVEAATTVLIDQLEERLDWSAAEVIEWEREHGFVPKRELTRRGKRVDSTYNPIADIDHVRDQIKRGNA